MTAQAGVRDLFDDWARRGRAEGMERGHAPAARAAFERLRLRETSRYLDVGCGNGYSVRWAAAACPQGSAIGIDLSKEMIARARALSEGIANASFVAGPFLEVELPAASFDAVFSMEVFYYFDDVDAAFRRARALLKPGGLFACVLDFYGENVASHRWQDDLGVPMTLLDSAGWAHAVSRAGLALVEQSRLRLRSDQIADDGDRWKTTEGSLLTLARR